MQDAFPYWTRIQALAPIALMLLICGCSRDGTEYVKRGNKLAAAGNTEEAILSYRKAIQRDPQLGEAHYRLGLVLKQMGNRQDAQTAFATYTEAGRLAPVAGAGD